MLLQLLPTSCQPAPQAPPAPPCMLAAPHPPVCFPPMHHHFLIVCLVLLRHHIALLVQVVWVAMVHVMLGLHDLQEEDVARKHEE